MKQISLALMLEAVNGRLLNQNINQNQFFCFRQVSIDSRTCSGDDLYIPIIGDRFDGHDFINDVIEKGCKVIIVSKEIKQNNDDMCIILVDDTKEAIGKLAAYYRTLFTIPFIVITGSVGKTTAKEMLASVLSQGFKVHATKGNLNNDLGVPLTILSMPEETEIALIEAGMDKRGELSYLSKIILPDIVVFTNIGTAHIGNLGSQEAIFEAKCEILQCLAQDGLVLIDGDDSYLKRIEPKGFKVISYGHQIEDTVYIDEEILQSEGWLRVKVLYENDCIDLKVNAIGSHLGKTAALGVLMGKVMHLDKEKIQKGIETYHNEKMRMEYIVKIDYAIINDAYNASYDSIHAAIKTLNQFPSKGKKYVALGDVFECGEMTKDIHHKIGEMITLYPIDGIFLIGDAMKYAYEAISEKGGKAYYYHDYQSCADALKAIGTDDAIILLKGSRGMKMEQLIELIENSGGNQ